MTNEKVTWFIVFSLPAALFIAWLAGALPIYPLAFSLMALLAIGKKQHDLVFCAVSSKKVRMLALQVVRAFVIGIATRAGEAVAGVAGAALAGAFSSVLVLSSLALHDKPATIPSAEDSSN